jgi:glucose-1-phosphate cytidylyltransferase
VHNNVAKPWRVMVVDTGLDTQTGGRFGVLDIDDRDGTVAGFHEKAKESGSWVNAGFMVMEPGIFDYLDGDATVLEQAPLKRLSAEGRLGVYKYAGFWHCMDTARDKDALEAMWAGGGTKWEAWQERWQTLQSPS